MNNTLLTIENYIFSPDDKVFIDANIWIIIFSPPSKVLERQRNFYSRYIKHFIEKQVGLFTDTLILSEYINRFCQIEFDVYRPQYKNYKAFRNSIDAQPAIASAISNVQEIIRLCNLTDISSSSLDFSTIFYNVEMIPADFNDMVFLEYCNRMGFILMSHDGDYKNLGLKIVSNNTKLVDSSR